MTIFCMICWVILAGLYLTGKILDYKTQKLKNEISVYNKQIEAAQKGYDIKIFTDHCNEVKFVATISHMKIFTTPDFKSN